MYRNQTNTLITKKIENYSLEKEIESLTVAWIKYFDAFMTSKQNMKVRLESLKSWDTCNGNAIERQAKINALNFLISNK